MTPRVLSSSTPFVGRAFSVRVDEVEIQPGRTARMEIVEHTSAVTILPLDAEDHVWFIRQYRHAIGETLLELPAGTLGRGEDPAEGAARELQEEIGMRPGRLEPLLHFWLAPGYSAEWMHVFLARELSASRLAQDEDELITVERIPVRQALALAERGEVRDSKSLTALLAAARRFGW